MADPGQSYGLRGKPGKRDKPVTCENTAPLFAQRRGKVLPFPLVRPL